VRSGDTDADALAGNYGSCSGFWQFDAKYYQFYKTVSVSRIKAVSLIGSGIARREAGVDVDPPMNRVGSRSTHSTFHPSGEGKA
jgi:hypothetical protein